CDRFEEAWKSGQRPELKSFVDDLDTPVGKVMLHYLLGVELAYRVQRGEQPRAEEYQAMFPQHADLIRAAFEQVRTIPVPAIGRDRDDASPNRTNSPPALSTRSPLRDLADEGAKAWPRIPGYEIVSELGRGAMGVVYKAWQQGLKRHVAVKVIRDSSLADEQHRKRFRSEAEAAERFDHPNLADIYDVGEHEDLLYFSMQLGEGGSLDKILAKQAWPARKTAEMAKTLAGAVQYAHEKNVIHRDLKPANIVLTENDRPLITDFGLAKRLDGSTLTLNNAVMGTAAYMPPEQARGDARNVGFPADVYSLGAILYEL